VSLIETITTFCSLPMTAKTYHDDSTFAEALLGEASSTRLTHVLCGGAFEHGRPKQHRRWYEHGLSNHGGLAPSDTNTMILLKRDFEISTKSGCKFIRLCWSQTPLDFFRHKTTKMDNER
jgi:hypothetical protein